MNNTVPTPLSSRWRFADSMTGRARPDSRRDSRQLEPVTHREATMSPYRLPVPCGPHKTSGRSGDGSSGSARRTLQAVNLSFQDMFLPDYFDQRLRAHPVPPAERSGREA